ncbi:hypothetical protein EGT67_13755 [Prescottella agglutinans]|uniref:DUF732 domain-containing protein n=1 Tax=Prescottella agglutinans TaxID=1644129 RepID=A0A438BEU2_9NOCA|nr:hypothetical protein EGT67_13755 [Prescottella agglutinans]
MSVVGVVTSIVVVGCTSATATDDAPHPATPVAAETVSATAVADARVTRYADALTAGGFPDAVPRSTLFALADGVCRQSAAGTPDSTILDNLRSVGAYGASLSGGTLTPDAATQLLLDGARADFC